ncbi:MAG: M23 family metallopeptidase [Clostridia bacterium]|nr:M23 family metallopeptidase [Clostridia bacterium]
MDYEENRHPGEMSKTSFIMIIVLCLLAIGAISYFAISGMRAKIKENGQNNTDDKTYYSDNGSYNNKENTVKEPDPDISEPNSATAKTEDEIPYEETEPEDDKPQTISYIMPVTGNVSKNFSDTELQYSATYGDMRLHTGVDIICKTGTDVRSAADGTVVSVEQSATLGRVVTIDHAGDVTVKYCGLESVNVKEGSTVKCNDVIGTSGTVPSEANDEPHIHIELYESGVAIPPLEVLAKH